MKVTDLNGVLRGLDPLGNRRAETPSAQPPAKETRTEYGDSLDLSLSARVSVNSAHPELAAAADAPLTPDRLAQIRARIADGYYNSPEVDAEIADRVLGFYAR